MREHLASAWEKSGKEPARLASAAELPPLLDPLWSDFLQLHRARGSNGFSPSPISFADIDAWQRVTGFKLRPWQLECIRRADEAYLASLRKGGKAQ